MQLIDGVVSVALVYYQTDAGPDGPAQAQGAES
jgi:nitrate reductase NapAB chaperone NapD